MPDLLFQTITPTDYAARRHRGETATLIDVREPEEWEIARIEGAELLPLSRFQEWIGMLDRADEIVVMCHHGVRSGQVCAYLAQEGFPKVSNLAGGIDRWSDEVDPLIPRY
jgi:rhodanese-related sulfurtransferase